MGWTRLGSAMQVCECATASARHVVVRMRRSRRHGMSFVSGTSSLYTQLLHMHMHAKVKKQIPDKYANVLDAVKSLFVF